MTEIETLREELAEAKAALEKARTFQNENAKIAVRMAEENKRLRESLAYLPREKANATTEEVWAALHPDPILSHPGSESREQATVEAVRDPAAYFSFDCDDGISWHATEEEAKSAAEGYLEAERDHLSPDDGWREEVTSICYGRTLGSVELVKCEKAPEGSSFDEIHDYALRGRPKPAPSGSIPAQTSQRSTNQEAQHARKHDAVSGTDTGTEGEDGRGSRGLHCADGDAGRTAQEPLPVAGPDGAGGERDVGEQGNHQGQRRDATRRGEGRVAPPAPVASEPKTSAAAGVVCECGHTEAEHGQPGCLYECCLGFRPAFDALRSQP